MKGENALNRRATVRYTEKEYDLIQDVATKTNQSTSEAIRAMTMMWLMYTSVPLIEVLKPAKEYFDALKAEANNRPNGNTGD